jgi:hypothetical protein
MSDSDIPQGPAELLRVEGRAEGPPNSKYRIYKDGRVVCWGPEINGPRPNIYIASVWSKHPLDHDDAVHLGHLAADSEWKHFEMNLRRWERTGEIP